MSVPLTAEEIAEIRELLAKATEPPWIPYPKKGGKPGLVRAADRHIFLASSTSRIDDTGKNCQADATCCSRWWRGNKLARLLDEVEAARQAEPGRALDRFEPASIHGACSARRCRTLGM